jgi:acyl carrier protein
MSREEILTKITATLREVFEDKNLVVTDATTAKDVDEWDSLNHITIISNIERAFKVKFALGELMKLQNIGQMIDLIQKKTA